MAAFSIHCEFFCTRVYLLVLGAGVWCGVMVQADMKYNQRTMGSARHQCRKCPATSCMWVLKTKDPSDTPENGSRKGIIPEGIAFKILGRKFGQETLQEAWFETYNEEHDECWRGSHLVPCFWLRNKTLPFRCDECSESELFHLRSNHQGGPEP
jgi:hypothetical protein